MTTPAFWHTASSNTSAYSHKIHFNKHIMMCERNRTLLNLAIRQCMYTVLNIDNAEILLISKIKIQVGTLIWIRPCYLVGQKLLLLSCEVFCVRDRINI